MINSLLQPKFFRGIKNATFLAGGHLIVQVITFFGFVYIARLLGPNDYGVYVTVNTFVAFFELLLLTGLNQSVMREGSKDISSMYICLEKTIGIRNIFILIAIIVCIISTFFAPYELQTKFYIIIFSFHLAYTGLHGFLATIYQANEKMQYISIFNILNRILFISLSITFLSLGYGLLSLFLVFLFSNLFTILINFRFSRRLVKFNFFSKIQFEKRLLMPAFLFSLLFFVGFLAGRIDLLMISILGTAKDVGIYGVAYRIVGLGIMLRNVTSTAFFPVFVKQFQKRSLKGSQLIKYSVLFFTGILILTFSASFFVEKITVILFGLDFEPSGKILRILIFYLAFSWASLPFTTAAQASHNEKHLILPMLFRAFLNIPLNYILFMKYGIIGIAYSTLIVEFVGCLILPAISYRVMKKTGYLE